MTEENINQKHFIKIVIATIALIVISFGATYAYYINMSTTAPTTTRAASGTFDVTSSLETANVLNNKQLVLIDETKKNEMAEKLTFTVTSSSSSTVNGIFNLYLDDIKLSKNLYSKYLKWELLGGSGTIASGTFENATRVGAEVEGEAPNVLTDVERIKLNTTGIPIPKNTVQNFTFMMYLANDELVNQINLTEGSFNSRLYLEAVPVSQNR